MKLLKSDRRVIILLMIIAVLCMCVMIFQEAIKGKGDAKEERAKDKNELVTNLDSIRDELMSFDPNTVDSVTLLKYGLGAMQIHSLMAYRRHNGKFDKPLAVSKLYNWSDEDVEKVLPYIEIDDKYKKTYKYREQYEKESREEYAHTRKPYKTKVYEQSNNPQVDNVETKKYERKYDVSNKFKSLTKVDINTADTALLKRIPGVGAGIANGIVRLREKLGGFYNVSQLGELKYVSPELYEWFEVEAEPDLHLININKASFQTLNAHPYISYNQTRDLMTYRRLYGTIKDKDILLSTNIFTKEEVERLAPYLEY